MWGWWCLYGAEPVLVVGLALERGLNFTSPLHVNFLTLAGLRLARMCYRRAGPS